jgi:hypothetical protein
MWDACGQLNIAVAHASDRVGLFTPTDTFQDSICRIADGELRRKFGECATERPVSPHERGYRRANRRVGKAAANGPKVFDKYQDRIVFGTDATPHGDEYPPQVFNDKLYEIYYRFLETDDEYFDYDPFWSLPRDAGVSTALRLPEGILRKVYFGNASRQLNVDVD